MKDRLQQMLLIISLAMFGLLSSLSLLKNDQLDFYVYRMGAMLALVGESPYNTPLFQSEVAKKFPPSDVNIFADNCGFFLPPQAIAMFAPFALLDWDVAQVVWFALLTACALACSSLAWTFGRKPSQRGVGWAIIVAVVLLNPITQPSLVVGQTTILLVGAIALGQLCFERHHPLLGCCLWSLTFVKPHLALLFLAFAIVQGGWKRGTGIVLFAGLLNLIGGLLLRGNIAGAIALLPEYLTYLGTAHKAVVFNLVEENYQITSWNRLLFVLGGPAINLRISMILGGYALWVALIACRLRRRVRSEPAYMLAAAAVGTLFFAQALAYEMLLLVLLAPLILQKFDAGRRCDAACLIGLLLFVLLPMNLMDQIATGCQMKNDSQGRLLLRSHKCFGMAALTLYLALYRLSRSPVEPITKQGGG